MPIRSCRDKRTALFVSGGRVREFEEISRAAQKALTRLSEAQHLSDLYQPPSNRFEALKGDRAGEYSIRINDKWRLCFRWRCDPGQKAEDPLKQAGEPYDVEITDYH